MDVNMLSKTLNYISNEIDSELQIQTLQTFLFIALRSSCGQKDIETHFGMSNASASRNVSYWTDRRFDRKPGFGFVERVEDSYDRRYKNLSLTDKGAAFFDRLKTL